MQLLELEMNESVENRLGSDSPNLFKKFSLDQTESAPIALEVFT